MVALIDSDVAMVSDRTELAVPKNENGDPKKAAAIDTVLVIYSFTWLMPLVDI
jgi:hypothetical protein